MAISIRENPDIIGIDINGAPIIITQMADDTTLFLNDEKSIIASLELLDHFRICEGLKLNKEKTEALQLGKVSKNKITRTDLKWVMGPIKVTGIWVGKDYDKKKHIQ